ncbi:MAG TPA: hypothetical protein VIH41_06325 [Myxococcales bacterium]
MDRSWAIAHLRRGSQSVRVCLGRLSGVPKRHALEHVAAPTLLIVGSEDREVIELNRQAYARLRCEKHLEIVPGATHLFEEPGTLEAVARLAAAWFRHFLVERPQTHSEATQGEIG